LKSSWLNAYNLMIGKTTYDELSKNKVFYLPVNHEDPEVLLRYFEGEEEYEKCQTIKQIKDV